MNIKAILKQNKAYIFWLLFYFLLFWIITGANLVGFLLLFIIYGISILFAFSPLAEMLWRTVNGVRPLRIRLEKNRLYPIFKEVYAEAVQVDPNLSRQIKLYIKEDMNINAFAFGKATLVITRGSLELLSDECIKGLIGHEFGHFSNYDTVMVLFSTIGNLFYSLLMKFLKDIKDKLDEKAKGSFITGCFKGLFDIIYYFFRGIQFISDLILMNKSRENEYRADIFSLNCGFGENMAEALTQVYQMTVSKPQSIKAMINSSHPPITKRIEELEKHLYQENET